MKKLTILFMILAAGLFSLNRSYACVTGEDEIFITITTDDFGGETSWTLIDANTLATIGSAAGGSLTSNTTFNYTFCEPAGGCYTFTIFDSFGDGICCGFGIGSYSVDLNGGNVASGGAFGSSESTTFGSNCPAGAVNDDCSGAILISCGSTEIGSTIGVGNDTPPTCGTTSGSGGGLWYEFVGTGDNVKMTTCNAGSNYDTKIRVYTGSCGSFTCVTGNDDASCVFSGLRSTVNFLSTPGTTYFVLVHGFGSSEGIFELSTTCTAPLPGDDCATAFSIACGDTKTGSTIGFAPDNAPFCGTGNGSGGGVWYDFLGTGDLVTISTCNPGTNYDTKLRVYTGSCGALVCETGDDDLPGCPQLFASEVNFFAHSGTLYHILVHGFGGAEGDFEVTINCVAPTGNEVCVLALPITCGSTTFGSTVGAFPDTPPTCVTTSTSAGGVWYDHVGTGQLVILNTCNPGTSYDTRLRVYTGSCSSLVCVTGNDDVACPQLFRSEVTFFADAGTVYHILVHGFGTQEGNFEMTMVCIPPPPNDNACSAILLGGIPNTGDVVTATYDNTAASTEPNEPVPPGGGCASGVRCVSQTGWVNFNFGGGAIFEPQIQHTVWYKILVPASLNISIGVQSTSTTIPSGLAFSDAAYQPQVALYQQSHNAPPFVGCVCPDGDFDCGCGVGQEDFSQFSLISANSYISAFGNQPSGNLIIDICNKLDDACHYYIQIDGVGNAAGTGIITVTNEGPTLATGPEENPPGPFVSVPVGGSVTFAWDNTCADCLPLEPIPPIGTGCALNSGICAAMDGWTNGGLTEPDCDKSIWYSFVAPSSGVDVQAEFDGFDLFTAINTQIAVWDFTTDDPTDFLAWNLIGANDGAGGGGNPGTLFSAYLDGDQSQCLTPGRTYHLQIDGWGGTGGSGIVTITDSEIPDLTLTCSAGVGECAIGCIEIALDATPEGGVGPYIYAWNDGGAFTSDGRSTTDCIPDGSTRSYIVSVTDSRGCVATCSVSIDLAAVEANALQNYVLLSTGVNTVSIASNNNISGNIGAGDFDIGLVDGPSGSITTPDIQTFVGNGLMFDVEALTDVRIDGFASNLFTFLGSTSVDVEVYYKDGTHVGSETNAGAWTFLGSSSTAIVGNPFSFPPSTIAVPVGVTIDQGKVAGFYLTTTVGNDFLLFGAGGAVGSILAGDPVINVKEGVFSAYPFAGTASTFNFNGIVSYTKLVPEAATPGSISLISNNTVGSSINASCVSIQHNNNLDVVNVAGGCFSEGNNNTRTLGAYGGDPLVNLPRFLEGDGAGGRVMVPANGTLNLAAGSYTIVRVLANGTLNLNGGDYTFDELHNEGQATINGNCARIFVADKVHIAGNGQILDANIWSKGKFHVAGKNNMLRGQFIGDDVFISANNTFVNGGCSWCAGFCDNTYEVCVTVDLFGDEISWTLTDFDGNVVANGTPDLPCGGICPATFCQTVTVGSEDGPLSFNIESQGAFNDNSGSYVITCNGNAVDAASFPGGANITESIGSCCQGGAKFTVKALEDDVVSDEHVSTLLEVYPNPFASTTTIRFSLGEAGRATLEIYSIDGNKVATLFDSNVKGNKIYEVEFDGSGLPDGIYFNKLITESDNVYHQKMILHRE